MGAIFAIGFVIIVAIIALIFLIKNMLYICSANEVMVFTGGRHRFSDTRVRGYRIIKGGRALRIPLLERIDRLSLSNISIDVRVANAYSRGGIPMSVVGVANVKIASQEPTVHNAIERFLDKDRSEIRRIAQETLEGNLRGVLATLTPEEVNQDKTRFAQSLMEEAEQDLNRLGIQLDNLKVQSVSDDKGYLDSIGRIRTAELQKRAITAEAESKSDAAIKSAKSKMGIALSQIEKEMRIAKANAEKRINIAKTNQEAMVNEVKSSIGTAIARVQADKKVQEARITQVQKQYEADVIQPATAEAQAALQNAKGSAAKIIADGQATVNALQEITNTWKSAGENARDVFLMQKLESVMNTLITTIGNVQVEKITMIDGKHAESAHGQAGLPMKLLKMNEELKSTMGIDLTEVVNRYSQKSPAAAE